MTSTIQVDSNGWTIGSSSEFYIGNHHTADVRTAFEWICEFVVITPENQDQAPLQCRRGQCLKEWLEDGNWERLEEMFFDEPGLVHLLTANPASNVAQERNYLWQLNVSEVVKRMIYSMMLVEACRIKDLDKAISTVKRVISYGVDLNAPNINAMCQTGESLLVSCSKFGFEFLFKLLNCHLHDRCH
jgi:hypothetical protein